MLEPKPLVFLLYFSLVTASQRRISLVRTLEYRSLTHEGDCWPHRMVNIVEIAVLVKCRLCILVHLSYLFSSRSPVCQENNPKHHGVLLT